MPETIATENRVIASRKTNPNLLRWVRQLHLILGTFFAPAIIFFALTGAIQTFGLHESEPGSTYHPPALLQKMAQLHKKQNMQLRPERPGNERPRNEQARRPEGQPRPQQPSHSALPLKIFVALSAVGLIITSVLGVYMAFKFGRDKRLIWGLLLAGTILPLLLIFI